MGSSRLSLSSGLCGSISRKAFGIWILGFVFLPFCQAQSSARTVARSLDQLIGEAAVIVRGQVVSVRFEPHPQLQNLMTVVVSMKLSQTYKGLPQKLLVFRQYAWNVDPRFRSTEYQKGQELILLLRPVSEYGLTSPVGLEQGRFVITSNPRTGEKLAANGWGNLGLFDHVEERARTQGAYLSPRAIAAVRQRRPGPVPVEQLEDVIRAFTGTR
jgi:hypothetical protein